MNTCIQSPPIHFISCDNNSALSPPPTPGRTRAKKDGKVEVPFFFPARKSVFEDEMQQPQESTEIEEDRLLNLLSNAPTPPFMKLKPRPYFGTEMSMSKMDTKVPVVVGKDESSPRRSLKEMIHLLPPPPLVSSPPPGAPKHSGPTSAVEKKLTIKSDLSHVTKEGAQKLPSIKRTGMDSTARMRVRRNSTVARCA